MGIISNSKSVKKINSEKGKLKLDNNISSSERILIHNQKEEEKIKQSLEKFWKINKDKLLSLSNDRIETNNLSTNNNNLSSLNNNINININTDHVIKTKLIKKQPHIIMILSLILFLIVKPRKKRENLLKLENLSLMLYITKETIYLPKQKMIYLYYSLL
jgi:hypothetical protein